jgi:hypothetical protein
MNKTHLYDPLLIPENIYQGLGISGQAHQSIIFDFEREMGFLYQELPYQLYFKTQSDLFFPKLKTTYSKIAYTLGIPKENQIYAEFAKYIKGVTFDMHLYATHNDGFFDNQKPTSNLCGDFLLHYELPSSIYGFKASGILNTLNNAENGGLIDIFDYQEHEKDNNDGYETFFTNARTNIFSFDFSFHNYVNMINSNKRYFGTFSYEIQICQTNLNFTDKLNPLPPNYEVSETNDTTRFLTFKNAFQWSNFMPYKEMCNKKKFIHIAGGIMHDYAKFKYSEATLFKYTHADFNSIYLFARTHIRLFHIMNITAKISYSFYGYSKNDLITKAGISWTIHDEKNHQLGLNVNYYYVSPEYIMEHIESNHFRWNKTLSKQSIAQLKAFWEYQRYNLSLSYYYLYKYVYLSEELRPIQDYNKGHLFQFSFFIPIRYKNFGATANLNLQHCTNEVILIPIFAGKISVFYVFEFLKKRLKIQIGTDAMYNTSYYADRYLPTLRMFYYQNTQRVGNFVYWDANITFQIDRINFFFRAGNLLSPIMNYRNFTTPIFPHKDYLLSLGISWKFFD